MNEVDGLSGLIFLPRADGERGYYFPVLLHFLIEMQHRNLLAYDLTVFRHKGARKTSKKSIALHITYVAWNNLLYILHTDLQFCSTC